ncbi:uncharacterized protein [Miscanthus floridulus]|uniref:uncharacterized protein n=1 Tax=Miscanthus floridulus TaxID=154761 RepID=UPI00345ADCBC
MAARLAAGATRPPRHELPARRRPWAAASACAPTVAVPGHSTSQAGLPVATGEFALSQKYHKELLRLKQNDYTKAHELLEHVYMDQQITNTDASDSRSFCNLPVCAMAHTYFLLPYSGNKGLST